MEIISIIIMHGMPTKQNKILFLDSILRKIKAHTLLKQNYSRKHKKCYCINIQKT